MPKATVHKDGFLTARKRDVGETRQAPQVLSEAVASSVQPRPESFFGLCISAPDRGHASADSVRQFVENGLSVDALHCGDVRLDGFCVSRSWMNRQTSLDDPRRNFFAEDHGERMHTSLLAHRTLIARQFRLANGE
jgi:hypothetical protein